MGKKHFGHCSDCGISVEEKENGEAIWQEIASGRLLGHFEPEPDFSKEEVMKRMRQ
jgi:hypothetical protein